MNPFREFHSMRKNLFVAGVAAAALLPSLAFAQSACEQRNTNRTAGTVAGAGIGALLGGAVAGRDDRATGAIVGGIGGAILGNQLSKSKDNCAQAYGHYDTQGQWHANSVQQSQARGYYGRDGAWVEGAPNGYYDAQGRWVVASTGSSTSGYALARGGWAPASAGGYYDTNGQWVGGAASGYYNRSGRWVAGPAVGRYDNRGRWIAGEAAGRRDANGAWIADAQPGYYENGRWRAGEAHGYYDTQGRWIATSVSAGGYAANANHDGRGWADAPSDFTGRAAWLDQRIRRGQDEGRMSRRDASDALRSLSALRREESGMRHRNGQLNRRDEIYMQAKLDTLSDGLRWTNREPRRGY